MSIPTRITDLSAVASSNSPTGAEAIGTSLDDYLRAGFSIIRGDLATKGADIASATTTDLGAIQGLMHDITGTTTITSFGTVAAGIPKIIKFEGALTLTHNATSLILPGGSNITTVDGDVAIMISEASGNWRCLSYLPAMQPPGGSFPVGSIISFAGATAPTGWLLCYGQAVSQSTYSALYALIGTTYGTDAGGNFTLPDLRGRAAFGVDNMGGSASSRVTAGVSGITGTTLGAVGGNQNAHHASIAITDPGHGHTNDGQGVSGSGAIGIGIGVGTVAININPSTTGITAADNNTGASQNMPPAIMLAAIVKY